MVSSNLAAASKNQYEQDLRYDDPGANIRLDSPLFSEFTIVKPGELVEFEEPVSVYLLTKNVRLNDSLMKASIFYRLMFALGLTSRTRPPFARNGVTKVICGLKD